MSSHAAPLLYLEDLHVGDIFVSDTYLVDADTIIAFATEYDPQPFHLDPEAAKDTFFGGLAASGWHTAAITMKLIVTSGIPLADGIIGAGAEIAWPRPTRPGDVMQVTATITDIVPSRSKPDRALVLWACDTTNQHGDVLQHFTPRLIVQNRPDADR